MDIPIPKMEGYVIYNPSNQKFSRGGTSSNLPNFWSRKPKIWRRIGDLKNHLVLYINVSYYNKIFKITDTYKGCIILNIVDQTEPFKISDYLLGYIQSKYLSNPYYDGFKVENRLT